MRNNFKLSAVAVALATITTGAVADTFTVDQTPGYGYTTTINTDALTSVSATTITADTITLAGADLATKITTNELEVNGPVTVDNEKATTTVDQAGTPATTPTFGDDVDGDGKPDTLVQTKEQTDTVTVNSQSQQYNENNLTFSSTIEKGTQTTTDSYVADITYDENGVATYGTNIPTGQQVTSDLEIISEDTIIVGKEFDDSTTALTIRNKNAEGEAESVLTAQGLTTGNVTADTITLAGEDLATIIADGDADTLATANTYTDTSVATEAEAREAGDAATLAAANTYTDDAVAAEAAAREAGDADTLATANSYTDTAVAAEATIRADADAALQANIDAEAATRADEDAAIRTELAAGDAATLESAKVYTDDVVAVEAAAREAGDQAIRDDIATKVTTNELEVNGPVTVNNVKSTTTVDQAGTPATTPTFGDDVDADGKPDTLVQTKEQTDTVTVTSQSQLYNENNLTFSSTVEKGTQTTTDSYVADISYDENGVATYGTNVPTGQQVTSDLDVVSEDTIIVGKEFDDSTTALIIRNKDADGNEAQSVLTAQALTTGNVTADTITLAGADLATTIADGDAATLASANTYTDNSVEVEAKARTDADTALQANIDAEATTRASEDAAIRTELAAGDVATLASANTYTDNSVEVEAKARTDADTALQANIDAEATTRASEDAVIRTELAAGDAATLASANTHTDSAVTTEAKARTDADTALQANIDAEAVTREAADKANATAIAKEVADRQAAITTEATARETGDAQTLTDAKAFTTSTATTTLNSAKSYTDTKATETLTAANAYTDTQVSRVSKKLDDVEKTSYRGIAIALAAQQQVPNIKPGQFAVFGGVGHYEGESAGALGVVSALADGRTSISAALGVAGSGEVGGRVGVAYVFGGN
ncbi:hypothetical protein GCM10023206_19460 [Acinetobacter puyangensis]|uniref:YadA-like C-terminal region n=1 Tax=Acinetobacter puyangensis TaxID=1096779 RepID=A0A240EFA0_9GAMM|nr:YadA-like family protein [Acinetobacter puyangensis]SNX46645.1 YadA-like C-terminal region [Acinetobacter puyangensis]